MPFTRRAELSLCVRLQSRSITPDSRIGCKNGESITKHITHLLKLFQGYLLLSLDESIFDLTIKLQYFCQQKLQTMQIQLQVYVFGGTSKFCLLCKLHSDHSWDTVKSEYK